jgi:hypothetical protein
MINCSGSVARQFQFSSLHSGGAPFTLDDGSTRFVRESMDTATLQNLLTRHGREFVTDDGSQAARWGWHNHFNRSSSQR